MKFNLFNNIPEKFRHIPQQPLPPAPHVVICESVQLYMEAEVEFEVKCIESDRIRDGQKEYKVQWTHSPERTWEPSENLSQCKVRFRKLILQ